MKHPALDAVAPALALALCAGAPCAAQIIPRPDHVVIVIEENRSYTDIIDGGQAPYINSIAAAGALMTQSFGVARPSQPNYIAFFSGTTLGINTNNVYPHTMFTNPNLGRKLIDAGFTFTGYSETLPAVGSDVASAGTTATGLYQRKHNPWVNWQDSTIPLPPNKLPPEVNRPYTDFPTDFSTLPTLSIIVPNQLHDMHDGTIAQGDAWAQANIEAYRQWCAAHNSLLIITWDEDSFVAANNNRVATIFYGPMVVPGQYAQTVTHYEMLRTLEDMFGLGHDANTVNATPITSIWVQPVPCYANCDGSTVVPVLSANDFSCFLSKFRSGDPGANCDGSTDIPTLSAFDFTCFLTAFRAGCP